MNAKPSRANRTIWRSFCELRCALNHFEQLKTKDRRTSMPLVNVRLIEGVFTATQKQEMIRKLTDAIISIEGENMRSVTSVIIDEVKSGDWGIGGNPLTTNDVKALAAGK